MAQDCGQNRKIPAPFRRFPGPPRKFLVAISRNPGHIPFGAARPEAGALLFYLRTNREEFAQ
jgi:hypothetical protein